MKRKKEYHSTNLKPIPAINDYERYIVVIYAYKKRVNVYLSISCIRIDDIMQNYQRHEYSSGRNVTDILALLYSSYMSF